MKTECDDQESLGRLVYVTAQGVKNFAERVLKPYHLTVEQFHILKNMSKDKGLNQRELGVLVNKTPANITRILDRLETKSFVVRRENLEDRRASLVFLTEEGFSLISEVTSTLESFSKTITQGITAKEQEVTRTSLNKITHNIEKMSFTLSNQE